MNAAKETDVPAHRVVNRVGLADLGKSIFQLLQKCNYLLEKEGVNVQNQQIQNFDELFWDPNVELDL